MGPSISSGRILFGAGGETTIHPAVLIALGAAVLLMLILPRRYVLAPLLLLSLTLPLGQVVMIGPFHFMTLRTLVFFAWIRLLWQRYALDGQPTIRFNGIDKAVTAYALTSAICYSLLWQQSGAIVNGLGELYNVLLFYLAFRFFIRDQEDIERTVRILAVVALIIAGCMVNEQLTGRNLLSVFGGVPELTPSREDYLRSQGPFAVYLTAGAFGATLLPLFLCLWDRERSRLMAVLGLTAALTIAITSRTSTALSACLAGVVGLCFWVLRDHMKLARRGLVGALVGLHLVMKAPVWALLARIDLVGGSTGWHRYKIIDDAVHHFGDWWLLGSTDYWTWEGGGDDMWDLANQYVSIAESTGIIPLICFLAAIVYCFKYLGKARTAVGGEAGQSWFLWLLGVALFSNLIAFFGISYFDQTFIGWYALLAMIAAAVAPALPARDRTRSEVGLANEWDRPWSTA